MNSEDRSNAARGAWAAAGCYLAWGLFPLFWKQLSGVNPVELIAHRHLSSLAVVLVIIWRTRSWTEFRSAVQSKSARRWHAGSGVLLTLNWLVFVWAVNNGNVLEASLGYFLVPLVNVAMGRFVLSESLRRAQWVAIGGAALGVGLLVLRVGRPPWIALALAGTFGAYGLLRKQSPLGPLIGLGLETLLLSPVAAAFIFWRQASGLGAVGQISSYGHLLLLCAGVVTAVPLLLFAYGARRIRLTTLGLLQYIAPTVQFALGTWIYGEPFSSTQALSFVLIWAGLAIYTADNLWNQSVTTG